jgi:threonine dehydrogenase-like Zn-dependent dehydrogenase
VWGCGPVGQFAIKSAYLLGAEKVIAIDRFPYRLRIARERAGAETINYEEADVFQALREMTGGRGPDSCIDCVGMEAHGRTPDAVLDKAKQAMRLELDRAHVLRLAIMACGKGGTLSVPGVYGGFIDKVPVGAIFEKGLQLRTGQTHTHRYMRPLLERIRRGEIDPSFIITHHGTLDDAPKYYALMAKHEDNFVKSFLRPAMFTQGEVSSYARTQELMQAGR